MSRISNAQLNVVPFANTAGECVGPVGLAVLHALNLSTEGITGGLHIDRIRVPKGFVGRAHKHQRAGVNIVLKGRARHYFGTDLQFRDLKAGDIFYVPAGEPHLVCSTTGCVAVEVGLGAEGTEFCPELDELWCKTRREGWLKKAAPCPRRRVHTRRAS